jgi:hypothetical protein
LPLYQEKDNEGIGLFIKKKIMKALASSSRKDNEGIGLFIKKMIMKAFASLSRKR